MSIEAIESILDHILDSIPEPLSGLCGDNAPDTPSTLDDMVDHLVSGARSRPARPVAPVCAGTCVPCAQASS